MPSPTELIRIAENPIIRPKTERLAAQGHDFEEAPTELLPSNIEQEVEPTDQTEPSEYEVASTVFPSETENLNTTNATNDQLIQRLDTDQKTSITEATVLTNHAKQTMLDWIFHSNYRARYERWLRNRHPVIQAHDTQSELVQPANTMDFGFVAPPHSELQHPATTDEL